MPQCFPFGTSARLVGGLMMRTRCTVSRAAWYPARHGIPHGTVSRTAQYPARHGIPRGMVSRTARYPARHGIPHGTVSRTARYPTRRLFGVQTTRTRRSGACRKCAVGGPSLAARPTLHKSFRNAALLCLDTDRPSASAERAVGRTLVRACVTRRLRGACPAACWHGSAWHGALCSRSEWAAYAAVPPGGDL